MPDKFTKLPELDNLKADLNNRKELLFGDFCALEVKDTDKILAARARGIISKYKALTEAEDVVFKHLEEELPE